MLLALGVAMATTVAGSRVAGWPATGRENFRWQGPFNYERTFSSNTPSCQLSGRERVAGTLSCTGRDLTSLSCAAQGRVEHEYQVMSADGGAHSTREDVGAYQGPLSADFVHGHGHDGDEFELSVAANVPVQFRERTAAGERSGSYVL